MAKKKPIKVKVEAEKSGLTEKEELTLAKYKLAKFEKMRSEATTIEELKNADFWIAHFKNKVEQLEQK